MEEAMKLYEDLKLEIILIMLTHIVSVTRVIQHGAVRV